jgi:uncharacterized protein YbcV (DUF1398 family)
MRRQQVVEMFEQVAEECTRGSDAGTLSFPEVLGKLGDAGVERYVADLVRNEKTYYRADGATCVVQTEPAERQPETGFEAAGVEAAIRSSQARSIAYSEFCRRVLAAGCVGYVVSLAGRRAVYFGRGGETHVEPFPPAA